MIHSCCLTFILNPSWSWKKCDPDQWLHRRRVLPHQHVWGGAGEHSCVWFQLHQACAEWKATGRFFAHACLCLWVIKLIVCLANRSVWPGMDFYLAASDPAARLPHEDSAQLPPPEEDGEGKRHACEKLTWIQRSKTSTHFPKLAPVATLVLFFYVTSSTENAHTPCTLNFRITSWLSIIYFRH